MVSVKADDNDEEHEAMAKPIKDTPVQRGKDAIAFLKDVEGGKQIKVSAEERRRAEDIYRKVNKSKHEKWF